MRKIFVYASNNITLFIIFNGVRFDVIEWCRRRPMHVLVVCYYIYISSLQCQALQLQGTFCDDLFREASESEQSVLNRTQNGCSRCAAHQRNLI